MPRPHFIKHFPTNETNLDWLKDQISAGKNYTEGLMRVHPAVMEEQQKLIDMEVKLGISLKELKDINKRMSTGEAKARRAKREMTDTRRRELLSGFALNVESWYQDIPFLDRFDRAARDGFMSVEMWGVEGSDPDDPRGADRIARTTSSKVKSSASVAIWV